MNKTEKALTISLEEAIIWTTEWRVTDHHLQANSFLFKADDFRGVLGENDDKVHYVRLYLGKRHNEGGSLEEKLVCVAVDSNGHDIINPNKTDGTSGIFDFSNPCPPTCKDLSSPLAGG